MKQASGSARRPSLLDVPPRRPSLLEHVEIDDQLHILSKAPEERTADDLDRLALSFGPVKFFQQFDAGKVAELCKVLRLETYAKDGFIYREGEAGNKCFVILSGSVTVYAPENDGNGQGGGNGLDETVGLRSMGLRERAEALGNRELQQQLLERKQEEQQVQQVEEVSRADEQNSTSCSSREVEQEAGGDW
mmetsp:Transcript_114302/g.227450  ORF Transcript_114302/g.227450 Transcript_114302/m.227450 type:complete len:191 (+) Transcript_114302:139-711(+)